MFFRSHHRHVLVVFLAHSDSHVHSQLGRFSHCEQNGDTDWFASESGLSEQDLIRHCHQLPYPLGLQGAGRDDPTLRKVRAHVQVFSCRRFFTQNVCPRKSRFFKKSVFKSTNLMKNSHFVSNCTVSSPCFENRIPLKTKTKIHTSDYVIWQINRHTVLRI